MAHWRTLIFALSFFLALCVLGRGTARADYVGNKYVEPGTGNVLEYNVYVPTGYDPAKKYPIMLVLHAANTNQIPPPRTLSSDGKGWSGTFINTPHQTTDPSFFMIPISQTNASGWGEATQPIATEEKFEGRLAVLVLMQQVMTKYNIDPNRLYITGPSMGGRGTWDIIRRYPNMFAAAAPAAAPASPDDAALYLNQNIWAICGEVDPIVQGERDTITAIRKAGGNPIYTELKGHGHDSWRTAYPDPDFVPWIYAQRLGVPWWTVSKAPTSVPGATITPGWLIVDPPPGLGNSFGGASGSSGGTTGTGGPTGSGGGAAGAAGDAGGAGSSSMGVAGTTGATETSGAAGAGGPGGSGPGSPSGTGGSTVNPAGSAGSGPASSGAATVSGGASAGSGAHPAGDSGDGGCSHGPGRVTFLSLVGTLMLLGVIGGRRRKRGAGADQPHQSAFPEPLIHEDEP